MNKNKEKGVFVVGKYRIDAVKRKLRMAYGWSDLDIDKWWHTRNPVLGDQSPDEMSQNEATMKKLELVIHISARPEAIGAPK